MTRQCVNCSSEHEITRLRSGSRLLDYHHYRDLFVSGKSFPGLFSTNSISLLTDSSTFFMLAWISSMLPPVPLRNSALASSTFLILMFLLVLLKLASCITPDEVSML